jgi:hypothetical protein
MTRFAAPDQGRTRRSKMHKQAEPLDQHVCEAAERWIREATRASPKSDDAGAPNDG